jgi:hypothetical protein
MEGVRKIPFVISLFVQSIFLPSYLTARGLPIEDADDENESGSSGKSRRRYQKRELAEIVVDFLGL